jgi:hypothetical protein
VTENGLVNESGFEAVIGRAIGAPIGHLQMVRRDPLVYDAFHAGRSVVRVSGMAVTTDGSVAWSVIEKVTDGPDIASAYLYGNAIREFRAYASDLLADLAPAVAVPRAHGLEQAVDGRLTLWLEDLGAERPPWSPADIRSTARHLGRLAGRWIGRVPRHAWLFTGWIERHSQPQAIAPALARLRTLRLRTAVEARVGWTIDRAIELIEQQPSYRSVLERMPQTLCHHDAVAANLFRRRRHGVDETVLIDWESVGTGPIGADLASLLFSSPRRGDFAAAMVADLLPQAMDAYRIGMRDVGAAVDPGELSLAVHAAIALRWALARDVILALQDATPVRRGSAPDESPDEAMAQLISLTGVLFGSAAEAGRALSWRT